MGDSKLKPKKLSRIEVETSPWLLFFGSFFSSPEGAKLSAAYGRFSDAKHGQNKEKSNVVRILTMFCPWMKKEQKYYSPFFKIVKSL